jgi:hypothetical protein
MVEYMNEIKLIHLLNSVDYIYKLNENTLLNSCKDWMSCSDASVTIMFNNILSLIEHNLINTKYNPNYQTIGYMHPDVVFTKYKSDGQTVEFIPQTIIYTKYDNIIDYCCNEINKLIKYEPNDEHIILLNNIKDKLQSMK